MKITLACTLTAGLIAGGVADLDAQGRGRKAANASVDRQAVAVNGEIRVVFSSRDTEVIREHYAPRYRNLPPGLQKKLARTGTLPPGWQKKMEPFPVALERRLERLPAGYQRGVIDGHAVIVRPGTSIIIDAKILF